MAEEKKAAESTAMVTGTPGTVVREEFSGTEMARTAETASSAVAAAAVATVQARYMVALKRPRDLDTVRLALLKECRRPSFAAVARYRKPIGTGVEGPSIRFAEAAMRCMGNLAPSVVTIYDDPEKRIVRVGLTDLEANLCYESDVIIEKTVERSSLKEGQTPISVRTNSVGKPAYRVEATDDDLLSKQGALVSKALREHALRILPGDIKDECMAEVLATLEKDNAQDPTAARKKLVDSFDAMGVKPSDLRAYLGHDIDASTPTELTELRAVWTALKEGESTWKDALEHKLKATPPPAGEKAPSVKDTLKAKAAAKTGADPVTGELPLGKTQPQREPGAD